MIFAALPERLSEIEIDEMLRTADKDGNFIFSPVLVREKDHLFEI